jgi:chemotaxis signal transduction protein
MGEIGCIPTIPPYIAGVVNYHGDALAVVHRSKLLGIGIMPETGTEQILVVTDCVTPTARFALPVDRVLGLVPGRAEEVACGSDPVTERITINGRVTSVLDPRRLVERAKELIESSVGGIE